MTTIAPPSLANPAAAAPAPGRDRVLGGLFVAEALLSFAPVVVLGAAIGWPASLDAPAAQQLAAIAAAPDGVRLGYGLYLVYSIAIAPLLIVLAARTWGSLAHPAAATAAAFAALSTLARSIGILRWLTVMPLLAQAHAGADPATRAQIERVFDATTTWGGGIGEILGVSLFMALAMGVLAAGAWQRRTLPRPLALLGGVSALALLMLALPVVGAPEWMPVALAVSLLSAWMLAVGIALMWRRG